jgi:hypothetical protein
MHGFFVMRINIGNWKKFQKRLDAFCPWCPCILGMALSGIGDLLPIDRTSLGTKNSLPQLVLQPEPGVAAKTPKTRHLTSQVSPGIGWGR